jgi:Xrn1 SH3-like domain
MTTTGCVEVVTDEEFIGGTTLQGSCSNFRGKLCVWAHLLKVTPENSKALVNKLVPKQSGAAGYDKIIASVESDSLGGKGAAKEPAPIVAQPDVGTSVAPQQAKANANAPQAARTEGMQQRVNRPVSRSGSTDRAGSAGRGKQGAWKEARGPTTKGAAFKGLGKRGHSTGLARWKTVISGNKKQPGQASAVAAMSAGEKTQELKAILGFNKTTSTPQVSVATASTAADLKALLGVGGPSASDGILLSQIPDPPMHQPEMMSQQRPQPPVTAAEKLFAMMRVNQSPAPMYPAPPQASSFNFTYVEEGKAEQPMQAQPVPTPPMRYPPMQPLMMPYNPIPMQYPVNNYSYGYPPPAHMMPPPPAHMHSPPQGPPLQGPSEIDFPPLGALAPSATGKSGGVVAVNEPVTAPSMRPTTMVPAVIASKSKR